MVAAIHQCGANIHHRVTRKHTACHRFFDPLTNRRDVLSGDCAADDFVLKLESLALFIRFQLDPDMAKLSASTGLTNESPFCPCGFCDRFPIGHLRAALITLHPKLSLQTVDDNLQVQLTHSADDCLPRLIVVSYLKRWVFFGQLQEAVGHLVLICFGLRLNRDPNHRGRKLDRLQQDLVVAVAERLTSQALFEADNGGNVAGAANFDFFSFVGMHLQEPTDSFSSAFVGVVDHTSR